ncbi:FtsX-like permease family protein [Nocardiopsis sp. CNT312]|uniref:ABC transporter permease n=1 Tax=Nocardiopsis sp. CNT312 TaxID=1137268 RepID=UPI00048F9DCB|nr:FtsX-like permease family protein [Nocardiopsis sp. CNT312]
MRKPLSLRLAWRMVRKDGRRALAGAGLLGLPVAVAVFAQILYSTAVPTAEEEQVAAMGAAQARVYTASGKASAAELEDALPEGVRIVPAAGSVIAADTGHGPVPTSVVLADLSDPLTDGLLEVAEGRTPEQTGEVLVSRHLGHGSQVEIGDRVTVGSEHTVTVTGLVVDPTDHDRDFLVGLPQDPVLSASAEDNGPWLLGGLPSGTGEPELTQLLGPLGFTVDPRTSGPTPGAPPAAEDTTRDDDRAVLLFTALGLGEVALLAAAVFTLSAQRRRRDMGLLAAAGARPGLLRRTVLLHGVLVAATGALAGTVVGVVAALLAQPLGERITGLSWGAPVIRMDQLVWIGALSLVGGLVAAWLPARASARWGPVDMLRDVPGGTVPRRRRWIWPTAAVAGLAALIGGTVIGAIPLAGAGGVVYALGLLGSCGLLLSLSSVVAARLPVRTRVALRTPARTMSRSLPLAVAICAVTASASVAGVLVRSADEYNAATYVPGLLHGQAMVSGPLPADDSVLSPLTRELGGAKVVRIPYAALPTDGEPTRVVLDNDTWRCALAGDGTEGCSPDLPPGLTPVQAVAVADEALVSARFRGDGQREQALRALRDGRVVVTDDALQHNGRVLLRPGADPSGPAVEMDAETVPTDDHGTRLPNALISAQHLDEHGLAAVTARDALLVAGTDPTADQIEAAQAATDRHLGGQAELYIERGYDGTEISALLWLITGLATVTAAGTAAIAGALSAEENARDDAVMAAVGAPPRFIRRMVAARLLALAVPASVLGALGGSAAMTAAVWAWGTWPPAIPWLPLLATVAAIAVATWFTGYRTKAARPALEN